MDKSNNKNTGNAGEDLAVEYLEKLSYKILGRNITYPFGEIDILAQDKGTIVIVEVKTVRGAGWGSAHDLVRSKKQQKLTMLALALEKEYPDSDLRIDVIGIDCGPKGAPVGGKIEHIKNAVEG